MPIQHIYRYSNTNEIRIEKKYNANTIEIQLKYDTKEGRGESWRSADW